MSNRLVFKNLKTEAFGGIDPESPTFIIFPDGYGGLTVLESDQGTNKSSTLKSLEGLLGAVYGDNYINAKSKTIKASTEFESNGELYRSSITKTQFKLEKLISINDKDKWTELKSPKTLISELAPYATSPEVLKEKEGSEQLTWLKKIIGKDVDETELVAKHKTKYDKRTEINREVKNFERQLLESDAYQKTEEGITPKEDWQKLMEGILNVNLDEVIVIQEDKIKTLRTKEHEYIRAKAAFDLFDGQVEEKEKEILALEEKIKSFKQEIETIKAKKVKGEKYLEENKNISVEIAEIEKELDATKKAKNDQEKVQTTNRIYKEYNEKTNESLVLTSEIEKINEERLAIAKTLTPDIEGLSVSLSEPKGIFLNGINISTLSESERYGLCIKIWKMYGTKVIFIENIGSLGSAAIEIIEMFTKEGGTVFCTQMNRSLKKMSVSFKLNEEIKVLDDKEEDDNE